MGNVELHRTFVTMVKCLPSPSRLKRLDGECSTVRINLAFRKNVCPPTIFASLIRLQE